MRIPRLVVRTDRTVRAHPIGSGTLARLDEPVREDVSVVLTMRVDHEEEEGESDLSKADRNVSIEFRVECFLRHLHVKHTVRDDLGVDGEQVSAFGETEDDRVSGPKAGKNQLEFKAQSSDSQKGHRCEEVEQAPRLLRPKVSS